MRISALAAYVLAAALAPAGIASAAQPPPVPPQIAAVAQEWFHRFQDGKVDRTQFDEQSSRELTDDMIRQESVTLKAFGDPVEFRFLGTEEVQHVTGYVFGIRFKNGIIVEHIAFHPNGKIAGIDFQTFVPR